jgi:hypothetical protein
MAFLTDAFRRLSLFLLSVSESILFPNVLLPMASCGDCHCALNNDQATCPEKPQTDFSIDFVETLMAQQLIDDLSAFGDCNPYGDPNCPVPFTTEDDGSLAGAETTTRSSSVCGVHYQDVECTQYKLKTYSSPQAAENAGAHVTHTGPCGLCSSMQDLGVYLAIQDMTSIGKRCAARAAVAGMEASVNCYQELGFTRPCSQIWAYNSRHTGRWSVCARTCWLAELLSRPLNGPPPTCTLSRCLQCDEDKSGPIFTKFAGRTRRSSGLLSAIVRPCGSIAQIQHDVCPETLPLI